VFDQYEIPFEYSEAFLAAMAQDLMQSRYATYEDLRTYMYGSAAAVGLMMSYIIGFEDGALPHAIALGEAMQMTNFLRDIREDYDERGRIYLPQEDLARFGITEQDIATHTVSEKWKELMRFEIALTRALFKEGNAGIPLLHKDGRRAVLAASRVYEAILTEIEKQDYDVFTQRAQVSPLKKTLLILQTLWKRNQS
jgi:phytoene synthase